MYTYLNIPQRLTSIPHKPLPEQVSDGSAEEVGPHGCFAFNLFQALENVYRREILRGGDTFGKLPFIIEAGFLFSWFQIVVMMRLDVPLVRGTEGQKTESLQGPG